MGGGVAGDADLTEPPALFQLATASSLALIAGHSLISHPSGVSRVMIWSAPKQLPRSISSLFSNARSESEYVDFH